MMFIYFINFIYLLLPWIDVYVENQPPKAVNDLGLCSIHLLKVEPERTSWSLSWLHSAPTPLPPFLFS